jgi:hypothetical protein
MTEALLLGSEQLTEHKKTRKTIRLPENFIDFMLNAQFEFF